MTTLSVLDLVPVRSDQSTADALAASLALAGVADAVGCARYWVAEHHNMPAVAATNPPVLVGMIAAATDRMRVGSGGVMLPNHAPLVVAEQFALLEAAYPGRIDLGIGRAPGSDPVTMHLLRRGATGPAGAAEDPVDSFADDVAQVVEVLRPEGLSLALGGRTYHLRATPVAVSSPRVWLLGSSLYSAQLAAATGLPYVFAHHFAGQGSAEALALYRSRFVASEHLAAPRTIAVVNTVVAATAEQARRLAEPQLRTMVRLRTGQPLAAQPTVEEALAEPLDQRQAAMVEQTAASWVIGEPDVAADALRSLAAGMGTDEIMVVPVAGAEAGTSPRTAPAREDTLRLLAGALL